MQNPIPRVLSVLFSLSEKAADGLNTHETAIGIMHNTEAVLRAELAAARTAENQYQSTKSARLAATNAQTTADENAIKFITSARDVLKNHLGTRYSQAWNAAGFINQSLEVPGTLAQRMELLKSLELYFAGHAAHEVVSLNVTAARAHALHEAFSAAVSAVNSGKGGQLEKRAARDAAVTALQDRLRGLIAELEQLIGAEDQRWLAFGFNIPGAEQTPEAPSGLVLRAGSPGHIVADWEAAPRATHYRVYKQVVDQPGDFVLAATVTDSDADLNTFASGARVRVRVTAVNANGESQPSEAIEQVAP